MGEKGLCVNDKSLKVTVDRNAQEFGMFFDAKTNSYWFGEKVKK